MSALKVALIYVRQSRHKDYERTVSPEVQEANCRGLPASGSAGASRSTATSTVPAVR